MTATNVSVTAESAHGQMHEPNAQSIMKSISRIAMSKKKAATSACAPRPDFARSAHRVISAPDSAESARPAHSTIPFSAHPVPLTKTSAHTATPAAKLAASGTNTSPASPSHTRRRERRILSSSGYRIARKGIGSHEGDSSAAIW